MAITNKENELNINIDSINIDVLDSECEKEIKIVILGEINSGKSSLIEIFFGNNSPEFVIAEDNEPTIGAEIRIFDYEKTKIGVFDLAGQEFDNWLSNKNGNLFYETDGVFLFFTLSNKLKSKDVEKKTKKLKHVLKRYAPKCKVTIILNKYDKYVDSKKGSLKKANQIKIMVQEITGYPTYLSSLIPNYYPLLKIKMERILSNFPVDILKDEIYEKTQIDQLLNNEGHILNSLNLEDATYILQDEFNRKISRQEIMQSEFI